MSIRLLKEWGGWLPHEMKSVDAHIARYERMQPISTTYDVELGDSDDRWRGCAVQGIDTPEEAGRLLDELYLENPFMVEVKRARVVKVVKTLEFEHLEVPNG